MAITERTLKKWRKEALEKTTDPVKKHQCLTCAELSNRILRMTQELLDQHLVRK